MKITYGSYACELAVAEDFTFTSEVEDMTEYEEEFGELEADAVAYAIVRYFKKNEALLKYCTRESWQVRLAKGKAKKGTRFERVLPAYRMELPGDEVRVKGFIDATGVSIRKAEITLLPEFDEDEEVITESEE